MLASSGAVQRPEYSVVGHFPGIAPSSLISANSSADNCETAICAQDKGSLKKICTHSAAAKPLEDELEELLEPVPELEEEEDEEEDVEPELELTVIADELLELDDVLDELLDALVVLDELELEDELLLSGADLSLEDLPQETIPKKTNTTRPSEK